MLHRITKSMQFGSLALRQFPRSSLYSQQRQFSDKTTETNDQSQQNLAEERKLGSFAKAFKEMEDMNKKPNKPEVELLPFKKLIRQSRLVDLGDAKDKIVSGKIYHTVADDLYIDFGWKFHCVCPRPQKNGDLYVRGSVVKLQIVDLELSQRFLGEEKDLTILEADCKLLGLLSSPKLKKK